MENIQRTAAGAMLQTAQLLGLPHVIYPYTTVNEKLSISKDITIADTEMPNANLMIIGNGGHRIVTGTNGLTTTAPIQHLPKHTSLYNQVPFVLRQVSNDLTAAQRANYRLRRIEEHDGSNYVAYYGKVLDKSTTQPQLERRTVANGVTSSRVYLPTAEDMDPTPPAINTDGTIVTTGDYIAATAKVPFVMSDFDVQEFLNVASVLYGDEMFAVISELGLCSSVDRSVTGDFNGTTSSYTEAIGTQIISFYDDYYSLSTANTGVDMTFNVGASEALLLENS